MFKEANAAHLAGDWADAERRYRALTALKPSWAYHNLGVVYLTTGRLTEAEAALRAALAADPAQAATKHSLGMLLLSLGRCAEGWPLYEARREVAALRINRPNPPYPEWRGEDLAGRRLLVVTEQGLGDQIQFARFLPQLVERGAQVTFACAPSLAPLFEGLGAALAPVADSFALPEADYWTLLMSLPLRLGLTMGEISGAAYLAASPVGDGGVGVVARGAASHSNDRFRSLDPSSAAALLALGRDLRPEATGAADFLDTARIVAGLDLVISVDTSIAHLAGAMGKPVWILLPAAETDWRWLRGRSDSPWYGSARLYRQVTPGDWRPVMRQVTADLDALGLPKGRPAA